LLPDEPFSPSLDRRKRPKRRDVFCCLPSNRRAMASEVGVALVALGGR